MKFLYTALEVEEEQPSLISELWQYFYDTYIDPSEYYENISTGAGTLLSVRLMIFGLCVGLCVAAFGIVFNKRVLGNIVRKILASQALSPESAMTLEELGIENSFWARYAVRKSTSLRRVVKCREEQEFDKEQAEKYNQNVQARKTDKSVARFKAFDYKINPYADSFYIPEDMKYMADVKFDSKGTSWLGACVFTLVMAVVFIASMVALPHLLSLIDSIVGSVDTTPKNII